MKPIGKNSEVLKYLSGNFSLLDASISKFEIHLVEYSLEINIYFQLSRRTKADINVLLIFKDVVEYGFYHNSKHNFYDVEDLKFMELDGMFYFSGDPYYTEDRIEEVSENDQDFVMSKGLEGYLL